MESVPPPPGDGHAGADPVAAWLARIVSAKEALEDGAIDYGWTLLHHLEIDLAGYLGRSWAA